MDILNFKEWLTNIDTKPNLSELEIANMYFYNKDTKVKEIAKICGKSIGEVYRILHQFGSPNRQINNHEAVHSFAQSGFSINKIAEFTGYTPRNIRYILNKGNHDNSSI